MFNLEQYGEIFQTLPLKVKNVLDHNLLKILKLSSS